MIEQISNAIKFIAFYVASKQGKTGLTVTVDVYKNGSIIVTGAACTEIGGGLYSYTLASGSVDAEGEYLAVFKTADSTVDQQWIPALWLIQKAGVERLDEAVSAAKTLTAAYDAAKTAASQASVNAIPTNPLLAPGYTAPDNASIAAIKAKTDALPADPADQSAVEAAISAAIATLPTVSQIEDGVLDALTADHNTPGTIGKAIGDAGGGSVIVDARVAVSTLEAESVASGRLGFVTHHTFKESIPSTTTEALDTATKVWLAVKAHKTDADSAAILFLEKGAKLTVVNGAPYGTAAHGSLAVSGSSGAWFVDVQIDDDVTTMLTAKKDLYAEVKALLADGRTIPVWDEGRADIKIGTIQAKS